MTLRMNSRRAKRRWLGLVAIVAICTGALASGALAALSLSNPPTFTFVNDEGLADDQPGQKDLSAQAVANPSPGDLWVSWKWDVTSLSGGNTGDACALFDTDTDSKVNFAICVTIQGNPAVQAAASPRVYTCGDGKVDRCTSTYTQVTPINSACGTNTNATDPFHNGQKDTQAICHIDLADVGGAGTANLVNTCSYPSQQPTSDPSDCVLIPRDAFIRIAKTATPNSGSFPFNLDGTLAFTASGTQTSSYIAIRSDIAHTVQELVPSNWEITGTPNCTGASGTGSSNGTFSGSTISGIDASPDNQITCSFSDRQQTGTLIVIKHVINNNGGTATAGQFTYTLGDGSSATNETGVESPGTSYTRLVTTAYNVTENTGGPSGYTVSYSAGCSGTIQSGTQTCTITNDDQAATLTVIKHVINDNGGSATAASFTLDAGGTNDSPDNFPGAESPGTVVTLDAGAYNVTESGPSGYSASLSADCSGTIANGQSKTCTVTNNDQAATLTVIKHVINDNGGTATAANFTLDSGGTNDSPDNFAGSESGTAVTLDAGSYNVTESGPSGYSASFSADCAGTIANGQSKTCTVTNNDNAATLTIIKHVINDNGGTKVASDWSLDSGGANDSPDNFPGSEAGTVVTLDGGSYNVTESGPLGYTASFSADCSGTIANGQSKICTVTNDDVKASPGIGTTMKWTLDDSMALTGFRPGGTGGTATFRLYRADGDAENCEADELVFTDPNRPVDNTDGTASTATGYTTTVAGTYKWVVTYSGNDFNDGVTSTCGSEVTTLP